MTIIMLSLDHPRRLQHKAQALVLHDRPHVDLRLPPVALVRQGSEDDPLAFTKLFCRKRRAEVRVAVADHRDRTLGNAWRQLMVAGTPALA
ncbi:hypothetical protein J7E70_30695 [Variovorax paradoxus]|nr:hypothetical protein [Variovorax paradoxus]